MIKITYTPDSFIKGNYPDDINYPSITINKNAKTILDAEGELLPYIEIKEQDQVFDKQMCVKNGVYKEFIKPNSQLLKESKESKMYQCKSTAKSLIETSYPLYTQANYFAEVMVIQGKQINGESITQEDVDLLQKAMDMRDFINTIRVKSQAFEASIIAASTVQDVKSVKIDFS